MTQELELQKFLRSGRSFDELEKLFFIDSSPHPEFPELIHFSYNQIFSDFSYKIVRESRGIILNKDNNWNVVCRGFDKFFNHSEPLASEIDWKSALVQEKLDGSLIYLWFYNNKWNVSTTGSANAGGSVGDFGFSFHQLFWRVFNELKFVRPDYKSSIAQCYTWLFELTTPYNRVVVNHTENKLTLIGLRNNLNGNEFLPTQQSTYPAVTYFCNEHGISEILEDVETLDPVRQEGYVVVDKNFNRIKIKSPKYVFLHKTKNSLTVKNMIDIIRQGEDSEFLSYFKEYKDTFDKLKQQYEAVVLLLTEDYHRLKHIEGQKEFALEALKTKCPSALFEMRKGRVKSIKEYLASLRLESTVNLIVS